MLQITLYISIICQLTFDASYSKAKSIWGGRQAELLMAQQAHALQTDEHKALPPVELQTLVQDLLKSNPYNADAVSMGVASMKSI